MNCQSCLDDPSLCVVADASVAINLNATRVSVQILEAFPNKLVVVQEVADEIEGGRRNGRTGADAITSLIAERRIEIVRLGVTGLKYFEQLVTGDAAETLDDGEAATIAYGLECGGVPVIDERKAKRICQKRHAGLRVACTVDILSHEKVQAALGRSGLADAVFNALHDGRMRVLPRHVDWVLAVIGDVRAKQCHSLSRGVRTRAALG